MLLSEKERAVIEDLQTQEKSIATEKLVSGEYNTEVFAFGSSDIRKLLADIQVEEQNHAEMLYKYKMVNCFSPVPSFWHDIWIEYIFLL